MAAEATLKLNLVGHDKSASRALQGVGREAHQTQGKLAKFGAIGKTAALGIAGALVGVGVAAVDFGKDSLGAYADAEKSQAKLEDAYKRFPKVANVGIDVLREYNQTLQRKTGADADDLAAAQAQLAAFKLNGKQIKSMSPLLIDYANKTGKSLPDAAKTLGKATLGNTKALKDLGISYKSTGDPAKDYANIMDLLKGKVGGYTDSIPEAEKKQKILQASFGDLQEAVGEKLQPAMIGLVDAGQGVLDWLDKNPEVVAGATAAFGLLGDVLSGLWDIVRHYVAPALGWLLHGQAAVAKGAADMLEALGNVPGFEWAKGAAEKVRGIATGMDAVASGLEALAKDSPEVTVETKAAQKNVADVQTKIDGIKGKIVTATAKGDDKELERLQRKLAKAEKKKWTLSVRARAISGGGWKITGNVSGAGDRYTLKAFRQGGRPRVGELAYFHADELWIPDEAGTVVSQARTRAMRGAGPTPMPWAGGSGGGDMYHVSIDARGSLSDIDFGGVVDRALTKLVRARRGRAPQFQLAVAR